MIDLTLLVQYLPTNLACLLYLTTIGYTYLYEEPQSFKCSLNTSNESEATSFKVGNRSIANSSPFPTISELTNTSLSGIVKLSSEIFSMSANLSLNEVRAEKMGGIGNVVSPSVTQPSYDLADI